jgi:hypothetical protein
MALFPVGGIFFSFFFEASRPGPIQPVIQWAQGALSSEIKRPASKADRSPPTIGEAKNRWSYTSTAPCTVMAFIITLVSLRLRDASVVMWCTVITRGTAVALWLRCCSTNRKVAGSLPDGVSGIFHWHNPSDRTMALGSTQPLTEMSTKSTSWG